MYFFPIQVSSFVYFVHPLSKNILISIRFSLSVSHSKRSIVPWKLYTSLKFITTTLNELLTALSIYTPMVDSLPSLNNRFSSIEKIPLSIQISQFVEERFLKEGNELTFSCQSVTFIFNISYQDFGTWKGLLQDPWCT